MPFRFVRVRFSFGVESALSFPAPLPANVLRGALGNVLRRRPADYARVFAPESEGGPSGLLQRPRPFVFRAAHLAGRTIEAGNDFWFDMHLFDPGLVEIVVDAFAEVANEGLGTKRARVVLLHFHREAVECEMEATETVRFVSAQFLAPTELKQQGRLVDRPAFATFVSLIRTRLLNLSSFYGGTPVADMPVDWRETALAVCMPDSDLKHVEATRFSTRTGQRHPVGGFVGTVRYQGELSVFVPYLNAAQYTGVGRQTSWGKGEFRLIYDHSS